MKLVLILLISVIFTPSFVDGHRRRRRHPDVVHSSSCVQWRKPQAGPKRAFPSLQIECYTEVAKNLTERVLGVDLTHLSRNLGCPIRIPQGVAMRIHRLPRYDDHTTTKVYSGSLCNDLYKITDINGTGTVVGPFWKRYNVLMIQPGVAYDTLFFELVVPDKVE